MSLAIPRPHEERASMVLPSVTCSSCSAPIPLSSLGDHVCQPSSRPVASRKQSTPAHITIPTQSPSQRPQPSRSASSSAIPSPRPPFAGPSSVRSSPANGAFSGRPSPSNLAPKATVQPTDPRTPSPTNPFFPHPVNQSSPKGTIVHGLGLGVGSRREGPYPTDAPLPPSMVPDTMTGGNAGMAGVGRRAFAAAAWGVRAGVAIAAARGDEPSSQPQSGHSSLAPIQTDMFYPGLQPQSRSAGAQPTKLAPWQQPTPREPPLLPRVPLSGRPKISPITKASSSQPREPASAPSLPAAASPPQRSTSAMSEARPPPFSPPQRSTSSMSGRQIPLAQTESRRKESVSSQTSSNGNNDVSTFLKPRSGEGSASNAKLPFFEKYKQMVASSSGSSTPSGLSPLLGFGSKALPPAEEVLTASPERSSLLLAEEDDDQPSALPWAVPALAASPVINQAGQRVPKAHQRHPTSGSEASSVSSASSRSGRYGQTSGAESEEVVTPSQSFEGLSERISGHVVRRPEESKQYEGMENGGILEKIGEEDEEDEGERVVFGAPSARSSSPGARMKLSTSSSTITPSNQRSTHHHNASNDRSRSRNASNDPTRSRNASNDHSRPRNASTDHSRSHTVPETRSASAASYYSTSERRRKVCAKCGDPVGGSARFVERDGIVLCEKDWKKLYLPSCRRCALPIEKSAVSSSDGQLKGKWHRECFTCTRCDRPFEGDSFYVHAGKPWCQMHYHEENGTLCASSSCRRPIEGPCILTPAPNAQRFHPGHLKCDHRGGVSGAQSCRESMDEYYEVAGGRYCERHVQEALRRVSGGGAGAGVGAGSGGGGGANGLGRDLLLRAEKRRTRLVELPVGGF